MWPAITLPLIVKVIVSEKRSTCTFGRYTIPYLCL